LPKERRLRRIRVKCLKLKKGNSYTIEPLAKVSEKYREKIFSAGT
jgi:hypothetical protein